MRHILHFLLLLILLSNNLYAHGVAKHSGAFFISPANNAQLNNPVTIKFAVKGILIAAAGVNKHKAGHYHLLIDVKNPVNLDKAIPRDKQHLHFDLGETETTLTLSPGRHSLQLVVADEEHEPFEELISKKMIVYVNQ